MKAEILSAVCFVALGATFYAMTRIDLGGETYDTQYIAMYDDGHTDIIRADRKAPEKVGTRLLHNSGTYEVISVVDYYYEGLELGTQYYIAKVRRMP